MYGPFIKVKKKKKNLEKYGLFENDRIDDSRCIEFE